jgi:co-chaperonin GroES (HSP10)
MQAIHDYYTIRVESKRQESITHGSLTLFIDTTLQNDAGLTYKGIVVAVPDKISKRSLSKPNSRKSIFGKNLIDRKLSDLPKPIIEAGDVVYLEYNAVDNCQMLEDNVYLVPYQLITAAVRRGEIVSQADNVVLDIVIENPVTSTNGIIQQQFNKESQDQGIVIACRPEQGLEIGDKVLLKPFGNVDYIIEGKKRYVAQINDIVAVITYQGWKN